MSYGEWCPTCKAEIVMVTRGIPSMGTCKNGHKTDRRDTLRRQPDPTEALAASPEVQALVQSDADLLLDAYKALVQSDADLLLDAYKALLVLHRALDKAGLTRGAETAENIADRIVAAHPEIPARTVIRAEAAALKGETT